MLISLFTCNLHLVNRAKGMWQKLGCRDTAVEWHFVLFNHRSRAVENGVPIHVFNIAACVVYYQPAALLRILAALRCLVSMVLLISPLNFSHPHK